MPYQRKRLANPTERNRRLTKRAVSFIDGGKPAQSAAHVPPLNFYYFHEYGRVLTRYAVLGKFGLGLPTPLNAFAAVKSGFNIQY